MPNFKYDRCGRYEPKLSTEQKVKLAIVARKKRKRK